MGLHRVDHGAGWPASLAEATQPWYAMAGPVPTVRCATAGPAPALTARSAVSRCVVATNSPRRARGTRRPPTARWRRHARSVLPGPRGSQS